MFSQNSDCTIYHGPNGKWDSDTTIWVPTWVVFSGLKTVPQPYPAGTIAPAVDYSPACIPNNTTGVASVYVYDAYLKILNEGGEPI